MAQRMDYDTATPAGVKALAGVYGPSSFAAKFSLLCKGIREMTTYRTQAGGR
jgi:hypothetical protein